MQAIENPSTFQVKSSLRLFRPPLTQTQWGLQDHKKKFTKQNQLQPASDYYEINSIQVSESGAFITPTPMMHISYSPLFKKIINSRPISAKFINFPNIFVKLTFFLYLRLFASPILAVMQVFFMHHALHVL